MPCFFEHIVVLLEDAGRETKEEVMRSEVSPVVQN